MVYPRCEFGIVQATEAWQTVNLERTYLSPVVVCTIEYPDDNGNPMVVRVRNAGPTSFDVKIQFPDASVTDPLGEDPRPVHYFVIEEGVYTVAENGVKLEAVKYLSTLTSGDGAASWNDVDNRGYSNAYTNPVVIGQVMTANDPSWSVFWARGPAQTSAPDPSNLWTGKHIGEDPDIVRANETVGYVVFEEGVGNLTDVVEYGANLTADNVTGIGSTNIFNENIEQASHVQLSSAGMDGGDGGWPIIQSVTPGSPTSSTSIRIDEDIALDPDRSHTTEQVAIVFFRHTVFNSVMLPSGLGGSLSRPSGLQGKAARPLGLLGKASRTDNPVGKASRLSTSTGQVSRIQNLQGTTP